MTLLAQYCVPSLRMRHDSSLTLPRSRACFSCRHGLLAPISSGGIEAGKVAADDLVRRVARDALGAAVPPRDQALLVERGDGVVDHALHQQPEPLLAQAQFGFVPVALGEVAQNLGEASDLSLLIP